jgi:hypothetical protein
MKYKLFISNEILSLALQLTGYLLVFIENWRIALGVFLIHWAINIKIGNKQWTPCNSKPRYSKRNREPEQPSAHTCKPCSRHKHNSQCKESKMPPTSNRSYRIKKSDNALTLPGRVTFPQGSYVQPPTYDPYRTLYENAQPVGTSGSFMTGAGQARTPYQMGTGTPASGLAGQQGQTSAMYPQNSQGNINYSQLAAPNRATPHNTSSLGVPYNQLPRPGFAALPQLPSIAANTPGANAPTVPSTVPTGGAAPFGYNAFGERLDSNGDVWNPATAKTDIYGGRFIQAGEVRWERVNGKLKKVQYGKGGKKVVLKGGGQQSQQRSGQPLAPQQQRPADDGMASSFVSFRA